MHDVANIAVYLPRQLSVIQLSIVIIYFTILLFYILKFMADQSKKLFWIKQELDMLVLPL